MAAQPRPGTIERAPDQAAGADHDLIVVGGGIYGIALALEAARRGLRALLVERADYGGATSWSNLRILHGGLRYLQSLDLVRFYESVGERRWFLRHFPDLVRPLPCLMPLYGRGLKRPGVFRVALALNDILSWRRNAGVARTLQLPDGRLTGAAETAALFPAVERQGLLGGALWHDAVMLSPERVAIEMLRWACACGASALNYVEATGLLVEGGAVRGILAHDRVGGRELRLRGRRGGQCRRPLVARPRPAPGVGPAGAVPAGAGVQCAAGPAAARRGRRCGRAQARGGADLLLPALEGPRYWPARAMRRCPRAAWRRAPAKRRWPPSSPI